jgi:3alpha(or 20beta)-hydroxysteroid dehydrogenase
MGRLAGKVAIITGAARGQGAAEAARFVEEGAKVVVTDVLDDQGEALVADLGEAARFEHLDVTDETGWDRVVAATEAHFGRLDILVNNAGMLKFDKLQNTSVDDFRKIMDVNLLGVFLGMKAASGAMAKSGGGSIVNISSTSGITGFPGVAAYSASKWGVRGLTRSGAIDLGSLGIRVNSVHPGSIDTPMIRVHGLKTEDFEPFYGRLPVKRLGTPDDVAHLVLFLASDESAYCTGAEFVVDGGQTAGDLTLS